MRTCLYSYCLSLVFVLTAWTPLSAQDISQYTCYHYTNENGLPQNSIKQIVPDNSGFIWMATEAGLVRFDGRHFRLFNKRNTGVLTSRMIDIKRSLDQKRLYALSDSWMLLEISNGIARLVKTDIRKALGMVYATYEGDVILPSTWSLRSWERKERPDSVQFNTVPGSSILLTAKGIIWYKDNKVTARTSYTLPGHVTAIFPLDNDLYCLPKDGPVNRLRKITPSGMQYVTLSGDILKRKSHQESMLYVNAATGDILIFSGNDLFRVSKQENGSLHTELLLSGFDMKKELIKSVYYDEQHKRLFLGSNSNGLFVLSKKSFITKTAGSINGNDNVFYEQIVYNDSSILSGKGVLLSSGNAPARFISAINNASNPYGNVIIQTKDRTIWTADHYYLYQHAPGAARLLQKFKLRLAYSVCQSRDGLLWLGTKKRGLYRLDPRAPAQGPELFLPTNDYIICLAEEMPGILWAGTEGHLFRIDTRTREVDTIPELKRKIVRSLYIPRPGEVWICTYEDGLYLYSEGKLTHFPMDRLRSLNIVHKILEDDNGFFWISTNNGLFQVSRQDLLLYAKDNRFVPFYLHYTKDAGFNTNEFNGGSNQVGLRLPNGYFCFSSMNGVVFFKPDQVNTELPDKEIIIENVEVDGTEILFSDTLHLHHKFARLNIGIASPYFGVAENLQFEYALVNTDGTTSWIPAEDDVISFNRLPVGYTEVIVRKRGGFGPDNYQYKKIIIKVPPSWWETLWFKFLLAIAIGLLIWLVMFLRVSYLRKRNEMLQSVVDERTTELKEIINVLVASENKLGQQLSFQKRLNENIAHDIHTPLKYLSLSARHLLAKVKNSEMPAVQEAESIFTSSERIYLFVKNLLNYLKAHISNGGAMNKMRVDVQELIRSILPIFEQPASEAEIAFVTEVPPGLTMHTHPELLKTLIHNLLDNAVKHTVKGVIRIRVVKEEECARLSVSDTGTGIDAEMVEKYNRFFRSPDENNKDVYTGFGFVIIKDIVRLLGGSIEIESRFDRGSTFTVRLPQ